MVAAFHVVVTDGLPQKMRVVSCEVESMGTESVCMVRARKGALAIVLVRACISVYFEDFATVAYHLPGSLAVLAGI